MPELSPVEQQFVRKKLLEGLSRIIQEQRNNAFSRIYTYGANGYTRREAGSTVKGRSGALREALENPKVNITGSQYNTGMVINYPIYVRFLDMKKYGNYKIYNRPIWGILYSDTIPSIRYEFRSWLAEQTQKAIEAGLQI